MRVDRIPRSLRPVDHRPWGGYAGDGIPELWVGVGYAARARRALCDCGVRALDRRLSCPLIPGQKKLR